MSGFRSTRSRSALPNGSLLDSHRSAHAPIRLGLQERPVRLQGTGAGEGRFSRWRLPRRPHSPTSQWHWGATWIARAGDAASRDTFEEARTMSALTREDVIAALGPVDDVVVAQIVGMGATREELAEARAWVASDEPLINS